MKRLLGRCLLLPVSAFAAMYVLSVNEDLTAAESYSFATNPVVIDFRSQTRVDPNMWEASGNITFDSTDGVLLKTKENVSAISSLTSVNKFQYGKFEFDAKIPKPSDVRPAIWMLTGNAYDKQGYREIDLMEHLGPGYVQLGTYFGTDEKEAKKHHNYMPFKFEENAAKNSFYDSFHTYRLEWTKDVIRLDVDNSLVVSTSANQSVLVNNKTVYPLRNPMNVYLTVAPQPGLTGQHSLRIRTMRFYPMIITTDGKK